RFGPEGTDYLSSKSEFARLLFNLDADFTPIFDWNTKHVFVTVVAEYQTHQYDRNLISIWDKIITRKEDAHLQLHNASNKYAIVDISNRWNFETVSLSLLWDKTPYFGTFQSGKLNNGSCFIIPSFTPLS
ncbi:SPC22-domain-containing protein, partial [Backusella circina FSU 941]